MCTRYHSQDLIIYLEYTLYSFYRCMGGTEKQFVAGGVAQAIERLSS
jgi:hypothetical protein